MYCHYLNLIQIHKIRQYQVLVGKLLMKSGYRYLQALSNTVSPLISTSKPPKLTD